MRAAVRSVSARAVAVRRAGSALTIGVGGGFDTLTFIRSGTGAGVTSFKLTAKRAVLLTISGGVFTTSAGVSVGTTLALAANTATLVYLLATSAQAVVKSPCSALLAMSDLTNYTNSPACTFNTANLSKSLTHFAWVGSNTGSGDIANLSKSLTHFSWGGSNTGSGDIANLSKSLTYFSWFGSNTVSGNIADLSPNIRYIEWVGDSSPSFSGPREWASGMRKLYIRPRAGVFTSAMVDALLISLSAQATWESEKLVDLRGNCGARTTASNSAVALLQSYGVTVLTN